MSVEKKAYESVKVAQELYHALTKRYEGKSFDWVRADIVEKWVKQLKEGLPGYIRIYNLERLSTAKGYLTFDFKEVAEGRAVIYCKDTSGRIVDTLDLKGFFQDLASLLYIDPKNYEKVIEITKSVINFFDTLTVDRTKEKELESEYEKAVKEIQGFMQELSP